MTQISSVSNQAVVPVDQRKGKPPETEFYRNLPQYGAPKNSSAQAAVRSREPTTTPRAVGNASVNRAASPFKIAIHNIMTEYQAKSSQGMARNEPNKDGIAAHPPPWGERADMAGRYDFRHMTGMEARLAGWEIFNAGGLGRLDVTGFSPIRDMPLDPKECAFHMPSNNRPVDILAAMQFQADHGQVSQGVNRDYWLRVKAVAEQWQGRPKLPEVLAHCRCDATDRSSKNWHA
ncbi:hypothetical protein EC912_104155 [Luteibacter rhizovicinus]|uniref:Uncharacterized protein n=1 Tax=Luteibacter rhizovicinus TaxID=242606 RepID=A0A4V2W400_9GAMM|nr:hypothetical protein [Luteibacter rhizovicinus]TCV93959.1 hypothetical protein EC912_104155 [Luteibacter rhizovicinus]